MKLRHLFISSALFAMAFSGAALAATSDPATGAQPMDSGRKQVVAPAPDAGKDARVYDQENKGSGDLLQPKDSKMAVPPADDGAR